MIVFPRYARGSKHSSEKSILSPIYCTLRRKWDSGAVMPESDPRPEDLSSVIVGWRVKGHNKGTTWAWAMLRHPLLPPSLPPNTDRRHVPPTFPAKGVNTPCTIQLCSPHQDSQILIPLPSLSQFELPRGFLFLYFFFRLGAKFMDLMLIETDPYIRFEKEGEKKREKGSN